MTSLPPILKQATLFLLTVAALIAPSHAANPAPPPIPITQPTVASLLASTVPSDWRQPAPEHLLYLELAAGRVVIELAPTFAPQHVANIQKLTREGYYDGLTILRVQDNYVVQWGDPNAEKPSAARPIRTASPHLPPEFDMPMPHPGRFIPLKDGDVYAREVGWMDGFPVARDPRQRRIWLIHSYAMVGAGRDNAIDSGGGAELYAVLGQAPRHLDRNVTLFGKVIQGMELLSSLPRGTGPMGFYERPDQHTRILRAKIAADVPPSAQTHIEILRTDTPFFQKYLAHLRNRPEEWFHHKAGKIDISNVRIPTRSAR